MTAALAYGLSVHHFVSQVGDYVGFAAIVAVAIMVLLLFAHARETAELRRRADDAEDELALLHEQVHWLRGAQQSGGASEGMPTSGESGQDATAAGPAPAPAPTTAGGPRSAAAATVASATAAVAVAGAVPPPASAKRAGPIVPAAPVGVGAPPLTSATKLIPPTDAELRAVAAAAAQPAGATPSPGPDTAEHDEPGAVMAPPAPAPSTVAAGGNGKPRRSGVAADPGGRSAQPSGVTSPRRNYRGAPEASGGRRVSRGLIAAGTLLVVAIVAVVVVLVIGIGGGSKHHALAVTGPQGTPKGGHAKGKSATGKGAKATTVNVDPSSVTVSVLNGTLTPNLAADVSSKLTAKSFQAGSTGNAPDQSMPTTVVGYVPAVADAKNDAYAVAQTLGLKPTAVKPVSGANQAVACSGATTNCPDQVIVTVGADLNSDAT